MSIPPLVCSTPPPPDQCEEDKDADDFDIPYNLSQDDEDDSFGYGDFSSFNHYQSNYVSRQTEMLKIEKDVSTLEAKPVESCDKTQVDNEAICHIMGTTPDEAKPKNDEDINIEDLGLEVNEVSISSSEKEDEQSEADNFTEETSENVLDIRNEANDITISNKKSLVEMPVTDQCEESVDDGPEDDHSLDLEVQSSEANSSSNDVCKNEHSVEESSCKKSLSLEEIVICKKDLATEDIICKDDLINNELVEEPNVHDDFGDFEDFQFANIERKASGIIENCDNPWDTNQEEDNDDFGSFTANFDEIEQQNSPNVINADNELKHSKNDDDEDFGDFDDFQTSSIDNAVRELSLECGSDQSLSVINFHTSGSEQQVMESITKVLTSLFEAEISEPEIEFEGRLETLLSETWRHLRETDVRQPYIINWNNSLGQKTLLRALCIDSRNILFGPKWGYNMPKYAVNLSAAPLQPQKPLTPSNMSQSEAVCAETTTPKPGQGGWSDPFTADGQESCNTERESVVEVTTTDLDVFEAAISSKPDKIYSSTLNVQPLRQISLPDTHIFTPTDSETPTSKTVHYDSGPPILLPQTLIESKSALTTIQHTNDSPKDKDDDEYWDFQDYKSSSDKTSVTVVPQPQPEPLPEIKPASKSNVTYQSQVLQPIRMEPLIPTVNWPDPGEIKETFDDFSDFVSNSTWSEKPREQVSTMQTMDNKPAGETDVLDKINDKHKNEEINKQIQNNDDFDDFDTFQSALPPKHSTSDFNFDSVESYKNIPTQNAMQIADFDNAFPKINNVKSETISLSNSMRPNDAVSVTQSSFSSNSNKISLVTSNTISNLLQPMPASTSLASTQSKQKAGQILQPLSLESYSQINWPNPGIDLQDLSRFNPVETLQSLKSDLSVGGASKGASPVHSQKTAASNHVADDDIWGEFVSSKPKQQPSANKKPAVFADDDEWTDFVSSPNLKPQNGLNTISLNVHTNSNIQKSGNSKFSKNTQLPLDIPSLNYITPKTSGHNAYNDRHFQNL